MTSRLEMYLLTFENIFKITSMESTHVNSTTVKTMLFLDFTKKYIFVQLVQFLFIFYRVMIMIKASNDNFVISYVNYISPITYINKFNFSILKYLNFT